MEWSILIPIAAVVVPVVGAYAVERVRARAASKRQIEESVAETLKPYADKVSAFEKRLHAVETSEPIELAKLRREAEGLSRELAELRRDFDMRAKEDDGRRERAGNFARDRDKEQAEVISALRIEIVRLQERLQERTSGPGSRTGDGYGNR